MLGLLLPAIDATPAPPMDYNNPPWSYHYDYSYLDPYGNPAPNVADFDLNVPDPTLDNPGLPELNLRLPSSVLADFEDDVIDTPHLHEMTPRTRTMVENVGRKGSRRSQRRTESETPRTSRTDRPGLPRPSRLGLHESSSHAAAAQPDSPPSNYGVHNQGEDDTYSTYSGYEHGGGSSNYPSYEQGGGSSSYPSYEQGGGSSSHYPHSSQYGGSGHGYPPQQEVPLDIAFTQMNMGEIPVQPDTSAYQNPIQGSNVSQGNFVARNYQIPNRREARGQWKQMNPDAPVPLRMLSAEECRAIGVARTTPRYHLSLWLEDRYLRHERNVVLGSEIPEPEGWQGHQNFERLTPHPEREHWSADLERTQDYLDILFDREGLFKTSGQRYQAAAELARTQHAETARRRREVAPKSPNDDEYRQWSNSHRVLCPLHMLNDYDLTRIGLAPGHEKYKIARYIEDQYFVQLGLKMYKSKRPVTKLPRRTHFDRLLTVQYPQLEGTFLHDKQAQVQEWFIQYNYMTPPPEHP